MPTLPATDGLPVWAQVLVSILVCIATLAVAFKGYFGSRGETKTETTTSVSLAAILGGDMSAIRHLADTVVQLNASVISLTNHINELTHYERNHVEGIEELCARTRALTEVLQRHLR